MNGRVSKLIRREARKKEYYRSDKTTHDDVVNALKKIHRGYFGEDIRKHTFNLTIRKGVV